MAVMDFERPSPHRIVRSELREDPRVAEMEPPKLRVHPPDGSLAVALFDARA
jgi:hypothetical protein